MKRYNLDLLSVPNQRFNTTLNGQSITIELRTYRSICYMSIMQNGEYLVAGVKCVPNAMLDIASVKKLINGNLVFNCLTSDYPSYDKFGTADCKLLYVTYR